MIRPASPLRRQTGFTLMEMAIVTVIIGFLFTMFLPATSAFLDQQRRRETTLKLATVDQALLAFVIANRRLPCPANGAVASGTAGVGVEDIDANGDCKSQATGVVPWATLGLPEAEATDAWGARFTYRVRDGGLGFTRTAALDASKCDPAGIAGRTAAGASTPVACANTCNRADLATCTSGANFLADRGLTVVDEAGNLINSPAAGTGAAYVLISPGSEGGGGFTSSGTLLAGSVAAGTNGEDRNANNQAIPAAGFFHDSRLLAGSAAGVAHFDDLLVHPAAMQLLTRAQLAPRSQ